MKNLHSAAAFQEGLEAYADLEGYQVNGVTIPAIITINGLKPDLVLINRKSIPQEVTLVELHVPWESSQELENARVRKNQKYEDMSEDIESQGFKQCGEKCPSTQAMLLGKLWKSRKDME